MRNTNHRGIRNGVSRSARVLAVAAAALGVVAGPALTASAASAADGGTALAGSLRKAVISGPFTIRDDEGWSAGTYCTGEINEVRWTDGTYGPNEWWRTYCGGEIRVELHAFAQIVDDKGTVLFGADALFYEGTKDTTTDLDGEVRDLRILVAAGESVSHTVYLKNKENGGKDYATLELTFTNAS
ncbi:hypothetical protein [Streptomyces sp. NPDC006193]|uniref:hypothetical protein n=1 Tax=Streptomyces sp. NPDC006193 TaxID=3155717 RepID=UPI0033B557A8